MGKKGGLLRAIALALLVAFCVMQWVARDACLDRGGVMTFLYCATFDGEPLSLVALIGAPLAISITGASFVATGLAWAIVRIVRRHRRRG